jgi:hypothetical protein
MKKRIKCCLNCTHHRYGVSMNVHVGSYDICVLARKRGVYSGKQGPQLKNDCLFFKEEK